MRFVHGPSERKMGARGLELPLAMDEEVRLKHCLALGAPGAPVGQYLRITFIGHAQQPAPGRILTRTKGWRC